MNSPRSARTPAKTVSVRKLHGALEIGSRNGMAGDGVRRASGSRRRSAHHAVVGNLLQLLQIPAAPRGDEEPHAAGMR